MGRPKIDREMARAAEMRVAGQTWATIGAELNRSENACKHWPGRYPQQWKRLFAKAEAQLLRDAKCESMLTLRQLLRSTSEPVRQKAAQKLIEIAEAKERAKAAGTSASAVPQIRQLFAYLEGLNDGQFRDLFDLPGVAAGAPPLAPSPAEAHGGDSLGPPLAE